MLKWSYICFILSIIFFILVFFIMLPYLFEGNYYSVVAPIIPITAIIFAGVGLYLAIRYVIINRPDSYSVKSILAILLNASLLSLFLLYLVYAIQVGGQFF